MTFLKKIRHCARSERDPHVALGKSLPNFKKNNLPYYLYHKVNETLVSNPFRDGLLIDMIFGLGKLSRGL